MPSCCLIRSRAVRLVVCADLDQAGADRPGLAEVRSHGSASLPTTV